MYSVLVARHAARDISKLPSRYPRLVSQHIALTGDEGHCAGIELYYIDDQSGLSLSARVLHRRESYR